MRQKGWPLVHLQSSKKRIGGCLSGEASKEAVQPLKKTPTTFFKEQQNLSTSKNTTKVAIIFLFIYNLCVMYNLCSAGYLQVLSGDNFILRYFSIEKNLLKEHANEEKSMVMRTFPLDKCSVIAHAVHKYKPFAFSVQVTDSTTSVVLLADTSNFRDKWIQQLEIAGLP